MEYQGTKATFMTELLFSKLSTRFSYDFLNLVEINNTLFLYEHVPEIWWKIKSKPEAAEQLNMYFCGRCRSFPLPYGHECPRLVSMKRIHLLVTSQL